MSKKGKYYILLEKSVQAALSAIEIYNKPDFKYREESFTILLVNAWELLLKSKILKDNKNSLKSIYVKDFSKKTKKDQPFKNPPYKTSRSGNIMTIDINKAILKTHLPQRLKDSLEVLIEIRDNAIHFINESKLFEKKVLEIGTASLKNYLNITKDWFEYDLTQYNFYLMPISFYHSFEIDSYSINNEDKQHKNLLDYINKIEKSNPSDEDADYNIALRLETKLVKAKTIEEYFPIKYAPDDPNAISIKHDSEDKFYEKYKWTYYDHLLPKLRERYLDFKCNNDFYKIKAELEKDDNFCGVRLLDPQKKKGSQKKFYDPNIIKEFDKYYKKKN